MDGVHVALLHRQEEEIPRQKCAKVSMRKGDRTWVFFHMGLVYFLLPSRKLTSCAHRSITPQSHSLIFPFEDKFIQSHRMRSTIATHPSVGLTCYILLFFRHTDVTHEGQAMALSILPGIVRCLNPGVKKHEFWSQTLSSQLAFRNLFSFQETQLSHLKNGAVLPLLRCYSEAQISFLKSLHCKSGSKTQQLPRYSVKRSLIFCSIESFPEVPIIWFYVYYYSPNSWPWREFL